MRYLVGSKYPHGRQKKKKDAVLSAGVLCTLYLCDDSNAAGLHGEYGVVSAIRAGLCLGRKRRKGGIQKTTQGSTFPSDVETSISGRNLGSESQVRSKQETKPPKFTASSSSPDTDQFRSAQRE